MIMAMGTTCAVAKENTRHKDAEQIERAEQRKHPMQMRLGAYATEEHLQLGVGRASLLGASSI